MDKTLNCDICDTAAWGRPYCFFCQQKFRDNVIRNGKAELKSYRRHYKSPTGRPYIPTKAKGWTKL